MASFFGTVQENGQIQLEDDPHLPKGAKVRITLLQDDSADAGEDQGITMAELLAAPFVGAWEDREDIDDSVAFAERIRRRWEQRAK